MSASEVTVINLPPFFERLVICQRCDAEGDWRQGWAYYEEFLHPDDASSDAGGVHVCPDCYAWLKANSGKLWLRTPRAHIEVMRHHERTHEG